MADIPVNLMETGGRLTLPGTAPPRAGGRTAPPVITVARPDQNQPETPAAHPTAGNAEALCPCCKWQIGKPYDQPDPEDAGAFREAVFAGRPFEKTFNLFGTVELVIRDLTADEELAAQNAAVRDANEAGGFTRDGLFARLYELQLGFAVVRIAQGGRVYTPAADVPDPGERHSAIRSWCTSDIVYGAILRQHRRFHDILFVLMTRATDRSFFVATGSGGVSPASPPRT